MRKYLKSRYFQIAVGIVAVAVLVAANVVASAVRSDRDRQKVATMTEKMKTVCVGRFLIDLPEKAEYTLQGNFLDGFDIDVIPETEEAFKSRVSERETSLRSPEPDPYGKVKKLETSRDLQVAGFVGKVFVFDRKSTYWFEGEKRVDATSVQIEGHAHSNGYSVSFHQKLADPERVGVLTKLLAQLRLNPENKILKERGFCIDHAYFGEPLTAIQGERITMLVGIPAHPDIAIAFNMLAGTKPGKEGLLARTRKADAEASSEEKARTKKLGDGPREINGVPGEQSLEGYHEHNGKTVYVFMWDSRGTQDDVLRPALSLELQAGVNPRGGGDPVGSSLSEKAVVDLWERISSSIRVRPTESPKVGAAEPPMASLGMIAAAGETCPFTGYWQCNEGSDGVAVLGGQRQYLSKGQRMPQALLLPPQTLWEKVRGVQSSFESKTPTLWKMVDRRSQERIAPTAALDQAKPASSAAHAAMANQGTPANAEIGCYATTGSPCPASGWWRSEDSQALDGTRWFAQGSLLPAATFAVPPGAFGKSADAPKAIQRRAKWQLMRLAHAPDTSSGAVSSPAEPDSDGASTAT